MCLSFPKYLAGGRTGIEMVDIDDIDLAIFFISSISSISTIYSENNLNYTDPISVCTIYT